MSVKPILFGIALILAIIPSQAKAGIKLAIDPSSAVTSLTVPSGSTFTIDFYLVEDGPENRLTTDGLFSFDFRGIYDSSMLSLLSINIDPTFDLLSGSDLATIGQFDIFGAASSGVFATSHHVLLGNASFQASAFGTSTISLVDTIGDGFILNDVQNNPQTVLDGDIFGAARDGSFNFQVTAVPEPNSAILMLAVSTIVVFEGRRRTRKQFGK